MQKGKLLILNGSSSCGKTTTCRVLQDQFTKQYMLLGIDVFSQIIPPKQNNMLTVEPDYFSAKEYLQNGKIYFDVKTGPLLDEIMHISYQAMAAFLNNGINIISDQLFWNPNWFRAALDTFINFDVFLVGMLVSDQEGARRENSRGSANAHDILEDSRMGGWNRTSAFMTQKT